MKREIGYYWVTYLEIRTVAEWTGKHWFLCGMEKPLEESAFEEIIEQKINQP